MDEDVTAGGSAGVARSFPRWRMVTALTAVAMLALLDKYALSLLVQPIKLDLSLSDTEIGLAVGAAFAIANIAIGVPAGWAADRFPRRGIVLIGVLLWSTMAAACGLAGSFWQFFVARAGVGLGEGLIPPASYALIRDGVPPSRHGRAFGVFAMSNTLGPGVALLLGGAIVGAIAASGWDRLPLLGPMRPWQLTLIVMGLAGIPLAALAVVFPDPGRHATVAPAAAGFGAAWRFMRRERAVFGPLLIFSCTSAMVASALGIWFPAFVSRAFGLTPQQIGPPLGLLLVAVGPLGLIVAGSAIDWLEARGRNGAGVVATTVAVLLCVAATAVPHATSLTMLWTLEAGVLLSSTCYLAIVSIVVARRAPADMVGKTMALMLLCQGVLGSGLAPLIVGLLADRVFADRGGLGAALSVNAAVLATIGVVAAWRFRVAAGRVAAA